MTLEEEIQRIVTVLAKRHAMPKDEEMDWIEPHYGNTGYVFNEDELLTALMIPKDQ